MWVMEERKGVKCAEPEASLWRSLPIMRHVKFSKKVQFSLMPIKAEASSLYINTFVPLSTIRFFCFWTETCKTEFIRIPKFGQAQSSTTNNDYICVFASQLSIISFLINHAKQKKAELYFYSLLRKLYYKFIVLWKSNHKYAAKKFRKNVL